MSESTQPASVTIATLLKDVQSTPESAFDLELVAGSTGLPRRITNSQPQKTGLALAGFDGYLRPGRALILGESEIRYLESLGSERLPRHARTRPLPRSAVHRRYPGTSPRRPALLEAADRHGVPVLTTKAATPEAMARLITVLDSRLAARTMVHGVLMDILGLGVLVIGESGIGKSECALDLIVRGHRLVADDAVELRCRAGAFVLGRSPDAARQHMEIRGLGLINVQDLFGVASTRTSKRVELVVQLERWEPGREYDRLGLDDQRYEVLGVRIPMIRMPVAPGRNVAILVEVAARNQLLKSRGHNAAERLVEKLDRRLDEHAVPDVVDVDQGGVLMREKRHAARRAARTAVTSRFVVLTGLSGSGKSQAIRALEDLGYFCVDNLPVMLLPMLAELTLRAGTEIARAAVVVDVREGKLLREFPGIYRKMKAIRGLNPVLIFLESTEADAGPPLQRNETAAPARAGPLRARRHPRREKGDAGDPPARRPHRRHVGDDGARAASCVHGRGERTRAGVAARRHRAELRLQARDPGRFRSAVRRPVPAEPAFRAGAASAHGRDPKVVEFLDRAPATHEFLDHTLNLLKFLVPQYVTEGKSYLTVGIGCTGGRHRSVAIAEALKKGLSGIPGVRVRVRHRDIANE